MMQNPDRLFEILSTNTVREDQLWKHKDLYRQLFNQQLFAQAYQNIYSNDGSMTSGVDKETVDGMSIERINDLIDRLRNGIEKKDR